MRLAAELRRTAAARTYTARSRAGQWRGLASRPVLGGGVAASASELVVYPDPQLRLVCRPVQQFGGKYAGLPTRANIPNVGHSS
jgi:hypothetical protein